MNIKNITIIIVGVIVLLFVTLLVIQFTQPKQVIGPDSDKQAQATEEEEALYEPDIKIEIFSGKMEPSTFTVQAGQNVKLEVVLKEDNPCIFAFEHEELSWIQGRFRESGDIYNTAFVAPNEPGEYRFYCAEEGHRKAGEEGLMIVN